MSNYFITFELVLVKRHLLHLVMEAGWETFLFKYTGAVEWNSLSIDVQTIGEKTIKCVLSDRILEEENSVYVICIHNLCKIVPSH